MRNDAMLGQTKLSIISFQFSPQELKKKKKKKTHDVHGAVCM